MLDYRINTFITLYNEMNYRKTAEKLNMTQPGVTQHIHYLEGYYGVKLFEYNGRSLSKTENAEMLKRHLDSVRSEEAALKEKFASGGKIHLKIGATKTIGEFIVAPFVRKFLSLESRNMDLVVDNTENLLKMLEDMELDFAVIEGIFDKRRYYHHIFKKENFVGICAKTHPFAEKAVSVETALGEKIVVREPGSGTRMLLERAIADRGYSLDCFSRCSAMSNFSVICDLVADGSAITFAYEPIARSRDDLSVFRVEDMELKGEFNFVYCNESAARPKIELFINSGINLSYQDPEP